MHIDRLDQLPYIRHIDIPPPATYRRQAFSSSRVESINDASSRGGGACRCMLDPFIRIFQWISQAIISFFSSILELLVHKKEITTENTLPSPHRIEKADSVVFSSEIPEAIYQNLRINPDKLHEAPDMNIDFNNIRYVATHATPPVEINQLLTEFDRICEQLGIADDQPFYQDTGRGVNRREARNSLEENYLQLIHNQLDSRVPYRRTVAEDINVVLQGIIFELRAPADGSSENQEMIVKKRLALENLCIASTLCIPRRHTEAFKVYRALSNYAEALDNIIKSYIQETKEDLFLNYYSLSRQSGHTLNFIRRAVGQEFGLDISAVNLDDPYIDMGGNSALSPENPSAPHIQPEEFRAVFYQIYTPANVLFSMKNFLNARITADRHFQSDLGLFFRQEIGAYLRNGELAEEDFSDEGFPYLDENYSLTDAGVRFLLVHFGHLYTTVPNGHLVRTTVEEVNREEV